MAGKNGNGWIRAFLQRDLGTEQGTEALLCWDCLVSRLSKRLRSRFEVWVNKYFPGIVCYLSQPSVMTQKSPPLDSILQTKTKALQQVFYAYIQIASIHFDQQ